VPYIEREGRLTLRAIERKYRLSTNAVAAIARVEPALIYTMERGGALARREVENILGRLSEVTGQDYSIETVGGFWIVAEEHS
jgi:hypothetical protein